MTKVSLGKHAYLAAREVAQWVRESQLRADGEVIYSAFDRSTGALHTLAGCTAGQAKGSLSPGLCDDARHEPRQIAPLTLPGNARYPPCAELLRNLLNPNEGD